MKVTRKRAHNVVALSFLPTKIIVFYRKRAASRRRTSSYAKIEKKIEQANLGREYSIGLPKLGTVPK